MPPATQPDLLPILLLTCQEQIAHSRRQLLPPSSPVKTCVGFIPLITSVISLTGCGTHEVRPDPQNLLVGKGAEYYLPRTLLVVSVPVTKTTKAPGRFYFFCEPLLDRDPAVKGWSVSYKVGDDITLETTGVRDTKEHFVSLYPQGPFRTFNQTYKWNSEGVLTHGEATVEDKTVEFAVSTLEAGAKIVGSAVKGASEHRGANVPLEELLDYLDAVQPGTRKSLDADSLAVGLRVLKAPNPNTELSNVAKDMSGAAIDKWKAFARNRGPAYNEIAGATRAARQIDSFSETFNRAPDAAARDKLERSIADLRSQFIGAEKGLTWVGQFRCDPADRRLNASITLFFLGNKSGINWTTSEKWPEIKPSNEFSKSQIEPDADEAWQQALKKMLKVNDDPEKKKTAVAVVWDSTVPASAARWIVAPNDHKKHGWYYRVPADAIVTIKVNDETKLKRRLQIAQHGCVAFLPATTGGAKIVSNIDLDPVTGALLGATHGGTAFDPGLIGRVAGATTTVIDAEKAAEKARATANDPITKLQREKTLLELKKAIKDLGGEKPSEE